MRFISSSPILLFPLLALLGSAPVLAAQVCNPAIPATAPDSRYQIHGDGTVTDGITGLMWKQCAEEQSGADCAVGAAGTYTWQEALQLAPLSSFAGYTDWRVPNIKELASLVEERCHSPAINLTAFPNAISVLFWSASPNANSPSDASSLYFGDGLDYSNSKSSDYPVRLVRGGQRSANRDTSWRVTEIYIATLGYAPDNDGLQYWIGNIQTGGWTPATVAQSFFDQPAVQALYPAANGNEALVDALYQNIFGRAPDAPGRAYWLGELEAGRIQRNQMIVSLIEGGWANPEAATDMARFGHLVEVGEAFAAYQAAQGILFSQLSEADRDYLERAGAEALAGVTADPATRDAAIANIPSLLAPLHD